MSIIAQEAATGLTRWSEFGLAGLVIAALFGALGVIVRWLISHIDRQAERHHEERAEWKGSVETSVKEISDGIKELVTVVKTRDDDK